MMPAVVQRPGGHQVYSYGDLSVKNKKAPRSGKGCGRFTEIISIRNYLECIFAEIATDYYC